MKVHDFSGWIGHRKNRRIPWPYCMKCGLVKSTGPANRAAAEQPCPGADKEDKT